MFRISSSTPLSIWTSCRKPSPRMADRLAGKGGAAERIVEFPNWVDTKRIHPDVDGAPFRAEIGIEPDAIVAL
jgi:colanic acid biosynthesis glycosyl transferase WcaI